MKKILVFFFAFSVLTGCSRTPVIDIRAEADLIKKIEDQWTDAIVAKDIDKIMGIFAADGLIMEK